MRRGLSIVALAWLGLAAGARAQLVPNAGVPPLKPVDPGRADVGPLSTSTRLVPVDLRVNKGFEGVYEFERTDQFGNKKKYFARSDGGLTAVFPRSEYVESGGSLLAQVPAGTVWIIGGLAEEKAARPVQRSFNALDLSADGPAAALPDPAPAVPQPYRPPEPPSIWNNERFRQQRMGALLESVSR